MYGNAIFDIKTRRMTGPDDPGGKTRFINVCNIILYSTDKKLVADAYNQLFTTYKMHIVHHSSHISISCFEDVVHKIIDDVINSDALFLNGEKYSPFTKLLAIAREEMLQEKRNRRVSGMYATYLPITSMEQEERKYTYISLHKIILYYIRYNEENIKNEQVKFFLKRNVIDFTK
jgi:uncharacterized protein YggL (DUF469 family)